MFSYSVPPTRTTSGYCFVTDRFLCAIGHGADHDYAMALWEVLEAESSQLEDVLSFFAQKGIAKLPHFGLVELVDSATGSVVVAVRGDAQVDVIGPENKPYLGAGVATWVEGAAQGVESLSVGLRSATVKGRELPLTRGVVKSDRVHWRSEARIEVPVTNPEPELPSWAQGATSAPVAEPVEPDDDMEHTLLMRPRATGPIELDDAEETMLAKPRARRLAVPAPGLGLDRSGGSSYDLRTPVIVGRNPKGAAGRDVQLVKVDSPKKEVSTSHVEFTVDGASVSVRDLRSTNGSIVQMPGRQSFFLKGGESVDLPVGTEVDVGDGNIFTVVDRRT